MNLFPRIHSLGTVNIIHHQEFYYKFHSFRTDFVGDSGVGKSIITDLLQLILIGSTEYSSSTQSKEDRPFQTLVLKTTDNTDFGYAYINVETASGQYLVLGTYIARNQNQTQAFIIQKSLDFDADNLIPLDEPIQVDAFERNGKWLPIDELDQHFNEEKDLGFKKFRRFSEYHKTLHINQLLPLDVTIEHALKDYAKILQTFARKNINIKDGVDLQDFLFGRQWRTHFKKAFEKVVSSMEDDMSTFRNNREQLDKIERKQKALKNLFDLKSELDNARSTWERLQHHHLLQQKQEQQTEIQKLLSQHFGSQEMLVVLQRVKDEKTKELVKGIPILEKRKQTQSKESDRLKKPVDHIEAIEQLMDTQGLEGIQAVQKFHRKFNTERVLYTALQIGKAKLEQRELIVAFDELDHARGLLSVTKSLQSDIATRKQELNTKKALLKCNDIDNKYSLVYWALNNQPKLTPERESMVLYFQQKDVLTIPSDDAQVGHRYIPKPAEVLQATTRQSGNGFWADLGGVHSFFEYSEERLFDGKDEETIKVRFRANKDVLKQSMADIEKSIEAGEKLQAFFGELEQPQSFLEAWPQRETLNYRESDLDNEVLNWPETQLNSALNDYTHREQAIADHRKAEKERDALIAQLSAKEALKKQLETFAVTQPEAVDSLLTELKVEYGLEVNEKDEPQLSEDTYYADFKECHNRAGAGQNVKQEVTRLHQQLKETEKELTVLELESEDFEKNLLVDYSKDKLVEAKKAMDDYQSKYTRAYGEVIANPDIVQNDRSRLEQTENFKILVRHVLPAIFQKIDFKEEDVWQKITEYMDDILHRNAEINKNKLVKVRDLMQELHTEIGRQTNILREVGNMLNRRETEISGGLKASLKGEPNSRIGVQWITQFLDDMPAINEGLWHNAIQEYLSAREQRQKVSIDELIIDEYKRYTDHPLPQITIDDLLSPFSYYTPNYKIHTASGVTNSGSTGQTYTAMALLCIAKLSMMKKDQRHQSDGLRFMSIDEAAGIGSNMDMLEKIARKYGYQILSLSIPLHRVKEGEQHIFWLFKDTEKEFINKHPIAVFSNEL
jgi:exonuclease SbcC